MNKLTAEGNNQKRPFKPKIYQGKRREQSGNYYDQDRYQNWYRSNTGDRRVSYRGRVQYGKNYTGRLQYHQNYPSHFRRGNFRGIQNYISQNLSGSRASTNLDRIQCFKCRECDHFAKDCPNISDTEKEQSEQLQQMLNLEEDKIA